MDTESEEEEIRELKGNAEKQIEQIKNGPLNDDQKREGIVKVYSILSVQIVKIRLRKVNLD